MVVVYGRGATWLERHAAKELSRYLTVISGRNQKLQTDHQYDARARVSPAFLVGENIISRRIATRGLIQIPQDLGEEGFLIRSVVDGAANFLLLYGGSPAGTLYAVYHYLERYAKVGFFWDGEQIPRREVAVDGLNEVQRPRFRHRQYSMGGYSSFAWGWPEWKREIEWAAKKRFNVIAGPSTSRVVWKNVLQEFGAGQGPVTPSERSTDRLVGKILSHARRLGLRTIGSGYSGELGKPGNRRPPTMNMLEALMDSCELVAAHPEAQYRYFKWGGTPPQTIIHPLDPMFSEFGRRLIEENNRRHGTDQIYFQGPPGESSIGTTPEERRQIKVDMARAMAKLLRGVDPDAIWLTDSWRFQDRKVWPKEDVRAFLDAIPTEMLLIYDTWGDVNPLYRELEYFFGKYWSLGVIHSFGGNTSLHGDLGGIVRRVNDLDSDPRAERCIGLTLAPEIVHHNYLYFDLVARLAWNPAGVELDGFLEDYAVRRYGDASAEAMTGCLKELSRSVYKVDIRCNHDAMTPFYQMTHAHFLQGGRGITDEMLELWDRRKWFVLSLERALRTAFGEAERQRDNPLFHHDIVDIARQYLGELFNYRMMKLYRAFRKGETEPFESHARSLDAILERLERLLITDPYYHIASVVETARALPDAGPDIEARVKEVYTVWDRTAPSEWLVDYTRRDFYEVVKFYYRPRFSVFIDVLRKKMADGMADVQLTDLVHVYRHIEYSFVDKPLRVEKAGGYGETLNVVSEMLGGSGVSEEELTELEEGEAKAEKIVQRPLRVDWDEMAT